MTSAVRPRSAKIAERRRKVAQALLLEDMVEDPGDPLPWINEGPGPGRGDEEAARRRRVARAMLLSEDMAEGPGTPLLRINEGPSPGRRDEEGEEGDNGHGARASIDPIPTQRWRALWGRLRRPQSRQRGLRRRQVPLCRPGDVPLARGGRGQL